MSQVEPIFHGELCRFHAKKYPAYDKHIFPYYMGFCQMDSDVTYDDSMNLRNIIWLAPIPDTSSRSWIAPGVLVVLDACPGGIIYEDLIADYVKVARNMRLVPSFLLVVPAFRSSLTMFKLNGVTVQHAR
ncbi:hypothetical protein MLD38_035888 [Melastoma candidum]|uniref:Uncharacterized protein n=1 Tax=Melastoma candidum TaxID=119954 RepID=A0ACB9LHY8_9MYRT|nr:hypothetical protein MLD38_035888 [Melastoma candidum]